MSHAQLDVPTSAKFYEVAIEGLVRINEVLMMQHQYPALYTAGVHYQRESRDIWRNAMEIVQSGWGDCEDLAAYRVAELRVTGEDPRASILVYKSGAHKYHTVVRHGDNSIEDPSTILGMRTNHLPVMDVGGFDMSFYSGGLSRDYDDRGTGEDSGAEDINRVDQGDGDPDRDGDLDQYTGSQYGASGYDEGQGAEGFDDGTTGDDAGDDPCDYPPGCPSGDGPVAVMGVDPDPGNKSISFDIYKRPGGGFSGMIRLPMHRADSSAALLMRTSTSSSPQQARKRGGNMIRRATSHPLIAAAMPPQAKLAAMAASKA